MMMTCREVADRVSEYLLAGLPLEERRQLDLHLMACSACRESVALSNKAVRIARWGVCRSAEPRADEVPEALIEAIALQAGVSPATWGDTWGIEIAV